MREPVDLGQRHGLDGARRAGLVCRAHVGAQVACAELDLARATRVEVVSQITSHARVLGHETRAPVLLDHSLRPLRAHGCECTPVRGKMDGRGEHGCATRGWIGDAREDETLLPTHLARAQHREHDECRIVFAFRSFVCLWRARIQGQACTQCQRIGA